MNISVGILTAPHIEYEPHEDGFLLKNVRIGIGFHWDRHEDQFFEGVPTIRKNPDGSETAINTLPLEDYLTSVISSEMSADSPMELLKAHAVISRSWALRAIGHIFIFPASAEALGLASAAFIVTTVAYLIAV